MTTTITEIDWVACRRAAAALGEHTRNLVAERDVDRAIEWALQQARATNGTRQISYLELACLLGHRQEQVETAASLEWEALAGEIAVLAAAVKVKTDEEATRRKAEAEARRKAEEAARAAEEAAEEKAASDEPPAPEDRADEPQENA
jgi:hypothetical protein